MNDQLSVKGRLAELKSGNLVDTVMQDAGGPGIEALTQGYAIPRPTGPWPFNDVLNCN